jgi:hypothetical protein
MEAGSREIRQPDIHISSRGWLRVKICIEQRSFVMNQSPTTVHPPLHIPTKLMKKSVRLACKIGNDRVISEMVSMAMEKPKYDPECGFWQYALEGSLVNSCVNKLDNSVNVDRFMSYIPVPISPKYLSRVLGVPCMYGQYRLFLHVIGEIGGFQRYDNNADFMGGLLCNAARGGCDDIIEMVLALLISPDFKKAKYYHNMTDIYNQGLYGACRGKRRAFNAKWARFFLDKGAYPEYALYGAARGGNIGLVRGLTSKDLSDPALGQTIAYVCHVDPHFARHALEYAAESKYMDSLIHISDMLTGRDACAGFYWVNALVSAAKHGRVDNCRFLIGRGVNDEIWTVPHYYAFDREDKHALSGGTLTSEEVSQEHHGDRHLARRTFAHRRSRVEKTYIGSRSVHILEKYGYI